MSGGWCCNRNGRKKAFVGSFCGILIYLFLCRTKENRASFRTKVEQIKPEAVWEYMADFSHIKELNPTVIDFDILTEKGDLEHWEYSTVYRETMMLIPLVTNVGYGDFVVKPVGDSYAIISTHKTCFFFDFFCYGTLVEEKVDYECPWVLTILCAAELSHQRSAVWKNLQKHFSFQNGG